MMTNTILSKAKFYAWCVAAYCVLRPRHKTLGPKKKIESAVVDSTQIWFAKKWVLKHLGPNAEICMDAKPVRLLAAAVYPIPDY